MDAYELAHRYFAAWNRRDAGAVLETIAPGGTYRDAATPGPLAGEALRAYMQQLWSAFPDLSFELGPVHAVGPGTIYGEWTMVGTNTGSMQGLPPSGRAVRVPGIDVLQAGKQGITSVTGYFDSALLPRQLGLDVIVQPRELGPVRLGAASAVRRGRLADADTLVVTELLARTDEGVASIREQSRQIIGEQMADPAFLAFTGAVIGQRLTTVSCWTSEAAMQAAMRRGSHARAMRDFFSSRHIEGGSIGIFTRLREGPQYRRCPGCSEMKALAGAASTCACGATLQPLA